MKLFTDIIDFLKTLTFVDCIFFFAVVILLILIVTLIYFIKENDEVFEKNDKKLTELEQISKNIEENKPTINFTSYEKDQEEKAIISYDELLKKSKLGTINYEEEKDLGDLIIKKVDLDDLQKKTEIPITTNTVRVISYQKEEDFLRALKTLQNLLN